MEKRYRLTIWDKALKESRLIEPTWNGLKECLRVIKTMNEGVPPEKHMVPVRVERIR